MKCGPVILGSLGILAGLLISSPAGAQFRDRPLFAENSQPRATPAARSAWNGPVAIDALPDGMREKVARIAQSPTIMARAPAEEFPASLYEWLLDHPDRVALAWRRLGVPCVSITNNGKQSFGWTDGQGSDLNWQAIWSGPNGRIWYAEGQARPGPHLPLVAVRAVAVLRCSKRRESDGRLFVTHDVDVYLQTDSRAAALLLKLIGPAGPRIAEQGAMQLLLFFSGIARHLDAHPEQSMALLKS